MPLLLFCPAGFGGTLVEVLALALARALKLLLLVVNLLDYVDVNVGKTGGDVSVVSALIVAIGTPAPFELSCSAFFVGSLITTLRSSAEGFDNLGFFCGEAEEADINTFWKSKCSFVN